MKDNISGCSVEEAMTVLGGRWRMLIISFLLEKPMRFNELRRVIPNISQRMLTLELRFLEEEGFVLREVYAQVPVKVEYSITAEGQNLKKLVDVLQEVGIWLKSRTP
ncbi:helix-turn-helix domain-containing protein [Acinetobacter sp. Ac_5812]|uniref:winged helix-turn-helix transcriptional regulator n=1 Tax=Acinetobacter sp. Ac_5812 TaxID=1848937 RepID=UPI00148F9155|nr:helix-turn-helix domain-containing protein [Acinetobacter sp. Ac_5812]NNP67689.1 HxlR family transcriptional regulator [Acinetobacter sp. Ac_5812]